MSETARELESWISVKEASRISGYSTEYIRELARDEVIKATKIGFAVLIDRDDLLRYKEKMDKKTQFN